MKDTMILATALGLLCALPACGDALEEGTFPGMPRYELRGSVRSTSPTVGNKPSFVAVVWDNWARQGDMATSQKTGLSASEFPATFTLRLYDEPNMASLNDLNDAERGTAGYLGTGYIVAFEDLDGDGELGGLERAGPDRLWARAPRQLLLFAKDLNETSLAELRTHGLIVNPEALRPGFNLASTICHGEGELYDHMNVVADQEVTLEAIDNPAVKPCLNIH
jgi:hypothetical protein